MFFKYVHKLKYHNKKEAVLMKIEREIIVTLGDHEIDITGILNTFLGFLTKLLEAYLPEEFDEIL